MVTINTDADILNAPGTNPDLAGQQNVPIEYLQKQALLNIMPYKIKNIKKYKPRVSKIVYEPRGKNLHYCNDMPTFMTTETLEAIMKKKRDAKKSKEKGKIRRKKHLQAILNKIEDEFRESAMRDLVNKFANYMANTCIETKLPETLTESFKRMFHGLVCNIYTSLGITGNIAINTIDHCVFETVGYVLVNMIIEAHFQNQVYPDLVPSQQQWQYPDYYADSQNLTKCLRKRALGATKKKNAKQKLNVLNLINL